MSTELLVVAWVGEDELRMEVARVERRGTELVGEGMQVGASYGLWYRLEPDRLTVQMLGEAPQVIDLGDADFFDLALSPLFNSLPVLRDGLLAAGPERTYRMRWVDVPSLQTYASEQRYHPHGGGRIGFQAADFATQIQFDVDGFVHTYPDLARRL